MRNKLISICTLVVFLFTTMLSVEAIAPTPRVDLDEYQITSMDINSVYVTGTVSICVGQNVGVYDSNGRIMYNCVTLPNTNSKSIFRVQIPSRYLSNGTNIFKIKSTPVKNVINGSNPKTLTVTIKTETVKKNQTITANNLELKVNETKNINASITSNLPLTYLSKSPLIATVDAKGNVTGRQAGTATIEIIDIGENKKRKYF